MSSDKFKSWKRDAKTHAAEESLKTMASRDVGNSGCFVGCASNGPKRSSYCSNFPEPSHYSTYPLLPMASSAPTSESAFCRTAVPLEQLEGVSICPARTFFSLPCLETMHR